MRWLGNLKGYQPNSHKNKLRSFHLRFYKKKSTCTKKRRTFYMPTQLWNEIKSLEELLRVQMRLNKLPILMVKSQNHLWILALIRKLCMRSCTVSVQTRIFLFGTQNLCSCSWATKHFHRKKQFNMWLDGQEKVCKRKARFKLSVKPL